jgi:ribosomal-protein-alanine N-acetyltransferase
MLNGEKITIRPFTLSDVKSMLELLQRNRSFLQPFEPIRPETYFTYAGQRLAIEQAIEQWKKDQGYSFGIFLKKGDSLIGRVNLSNVVRGAWQNCTIGYFLDEQMQGKGYMTEAVKLAVQYAFATAGLHRVQAAIMPRNLASKRVIEKAGFRYEGISKRYLYINGKWEDHEIYAITSEEWPMALI